MKRTKRIGLRVSPHERASIERSATEYGASMSLYLRTLHLVFDGLPRAAACLSAMARQSRHWDSTDARQP